MLWLSLTARNAGQRPSKLAGLHESLGDNDLACLDFDLACSLRLQKYDIECDQTRAKMIANEVSKMFGSNEDEAAAAEVW